MDWNVQRCRIGNNIIKITEISVLQMFVKGYSINIYNSTSVIINCVSFFVYISWATIRVVVFWPCLLQIKAAKEFEIEGPDEKKSPNSSHVYCILTENVFFQFIVCIHSIMQ